MHDLTTPQGAEAYLRESTSPDDWNARVLEIKRMNDGGKPDFWDAIVVNTDLDSQVLPGREGMMITTL